MPHFSFIKHGTGENPNVTMTITTDSLEVLCESFNDFVRGAGFVVPEEEDDDDLSPTKKDDWDWEIPETSIPEFDTLNLSFLDNYIREKQ